MRVRERVGVAVATLLVLGSGAAVALGQTGPAPQPVELQLQEVEAEVDALGAKFAVATEAEQDALLVQIGALQNARAELCVQLSRSSDALDLYC
jgi:hypothetical protein